jgi:hypothetical protein
MSTCEMLEVIRDAKQQQEEARRDRSALVENDLRVLLSLPPAYSAPAPPVDSTRKGYCGWVESLQELILPKTAKAAAGESQTVELV